MLKILSQEDLFPTSPLPPTDAPSGEQTNFNLNLLFGENLLENPLLDLGTSSLNLFILGWTIFYNIFFLYHFFNHRIFFGYGEYSVEENGMKGIYSSIFIWWTYIVALTFFIAYGYFRNTSFGVVTAILYLFISLIKIYLDLGKILDLLNYFPWSKTMVSGLKKFLKM